jgi:hypothetical protein
MKKARLAVMCSRYAAEKKAEKKLALFLDPYLTS